VASDNNKNQKGFASNAMTLVGSNIVAQIITLAFIPIITRIYSPEAFGQFASILAIAFLFASVSSFRYSAAILLPESENSSDALTLLSMIMVFAFSVGLCVAVIFFEHEIRNYANLQVGDISVYLIPFIMLLAGIKLIVDAWYLREEAFKALAYSHIFEAGSDRISSITLGIVASAGALGLLIGKMTGLLLSIFTLILNGKSRRLTSIVSTSSIRQIIPVAKEYRRFPIFSWSALLQQGTVQLPIIMMGIYYQPAIVGYLALARRILLEPANIIGVAVQKSFHQKIALDYREGRDIKDSTLRLLRSMLAYITIPMMLFSFSAEYLFAIIFGETWRQSGQYAQVLTPMFIAVLLVLPFSALFDILHKQKEQGIYNMSVLVVGFITLSLGGVFLDPYYTVVLFSAGSTLLILSRIVSLMQYAGVTAKEAINAIMEALILTFIAAMPIVVTKYMFKYDFIVIFILSIVVFVTYILYLYKTDIFIANIASTLFCKKKMK